MNRNERYLLNTELLRTFAAIANCGNLTTAAGRLNRTQSAVSVQLRKLESNLHTVLFDRTAKGMALTGAGLRLLPKALAILKDIEQASSLFDVALTGSIRVGIPDDFNHTVLENILTEFALSHPGVDVEAISGCTSTYPDAVRKEELDIAVCSSPNAGSGKILGAEKIVWAVKQGTILNENQPVPLAILDRNCWWRDIPIAALNSVKREYKIAFRSSDFGSIQSAIRAGFAIGVLPASCIEEAMVTLSKHQGFPILPNSNRSIIIGSHTDENLAKAMTEAIKNARSKNNR